ncbi:chitin synthase-domain-containing protein [Entophlyctis helioformis]|nr:chitin synthase-domain-containing protein [Entophlyctis helioformis]
MADARRRAQGATGATGAGATGAGTAGGIPPLPVLVGGPAAGAGAGPGSDSMPMQTFAFSAAPATTSGTHNASLYEYGNDGSGNGRSPYPYADGDGGGGNGDAYPYSYPSSAGVGIAVAVPPTITRRPTLFRKGATSVPSSAFNASASDGGLSRNNSTIGVSNDGLIPRRSNTLTRRGTLGRSGTLNRNATGMGAGAMSNMLAKPLDDSRPTPWVVFSWLTTCCFPSAILSSCGIKNRSSQQAWREKVALCWVSAVLCAMVIFFLIFFNNILCPANLLANTVDINVYGGVVVFGRMYNSLLATPPYNTLFEQTDALFSGIDASGSFEQAPISSCQLPIVSRFKFAGVKSSCAPDCINLDELITRHNFKPFETVKGNTGQNVSVQPDPAYEWGEVKRRSLIVIRQKVLNLAPYFDAFPDPVPGDIIDPLLRKAQAINDGTRILWQHPDVPAEAINCLTEKYYAGVLSQLPMSCIMSRLFTIVVSVVVISILLTRFFMALFFDWFIANRMIRDPSPADLAMNNHQGSPLSSVPRKGAVALRQDPNVPRPVPNPTDMYTVLFVTCYSEGEDALRTTIDSLASTDYDDSKKILIVVADGLVKGSGNDDTTPNLLIKMMDHDTTFGETPEAFSYVAIATGPKQHNMARVYSGSYEYKGRHVPMVLVVKCGTPVEADQPKPGNRGKRDSQLILMNFFSRVVLNDRMTPLDYDIFRKIHHLTGVTPDQFEIVLMVDADTRVAPDSLRFMINAMQNDSRIIGLCGETRIANKRSSWVTAIQVFEYFISHHLGKSFESVFGGVTCLPGCFCMYRIKTQKDGAVLPILANPDIIEQYSTNEVYTLHQKNLLLLGEDRFLSTLMLRTFPKRHMVFVPAAFCKTTVPDDFSTLVSQRRRWINSTIHNLMELVFVNNLCGIFCFSMQFIVFMDLIGTAVLPAALCAAYYLIYAAAAKTVYDNVTAYLNLSMLLVAIFLPMLLVIFTARRVHYILWMFVYLLALPVWQIILPLYAFWHFDDFSWGETRKVTGEGKSGGHHDDEVGLFDGSKIPFKRWDEYEREWRREVLSRQSSDYLPGKMDAHKTHGMDTSFSDNRSSAESAMTATAGYRPSFGYTTNYGDSHAYPHGHAMSTISDFSENMAPQSVGRGQDPYASRRG